MSELPHIGNETILERFGEELGQWIGQLKGLFLKKYSWDLVRSTRSFGCKFPERLEHNMRVEVNLGTSWLIDIVSDTARQGISIADNVNKL